MKTSQSIKIPELLYNALKLQFKKSSFNSVDDFIIYILQNYLDQQKIEVDSNMQSKDDAEVLKRLKDLGYM
jgi:hypothetical protein